MKLYDFTIAPNPRRVRIFLAEKGVEIPIVQIDLMQGEQFSPEFSQKCPSNEVPLLELDNGVCISQVDAICRYIEAKYPQNPLYGNRDFAQTRCTESQASPQHQSTAPS